MNPESHIADLISQYTSSYVIHPNNDDWNYTSGFSIEGYFNEHNSIDEIVKKCGQSALKNLEEDNV